MNIANRSKLLKVVAGYHGTGHYQGFWCSAVQTLSSLLPTGSSSSLSGPSNSSDRGSPALKLVYENDESLNCDLRSDSVLDYERDLQAQQRSTAEEPQQCSTFSSSTSSEVAESNSQSYPLSRPQLASNSNGSLSGNQRIFQTALRPFAGQLLHNSSTQSQSCWSQGVLPTPALPCTGTSLPGFRILKFRDMHQRLFSSSRSLLVNDTQDQQSTKNEGPVFQGKDAAGAAEVDMSSGWTRKEVVNWPNAISLLRLLSGPVLAGLILKGETPWAVWGLIVAGISDWLDGFVAKRYDQNSVLGTYLDPLADKVLMASVVGALAWQGMLPLWIVGLTVGRDVALVAAAFWWRAQSLGWKWLGPGHFFKLGNDGGAAPMKPLFISKVNTVFQLVLVASALSGSAWELPDRVAVEALGYLVGGTTVLSGFGYIAQYRRRLRDARNSTMKTKV